MTEKWSCAVLRGLGSRKAPRLPDTIRQFPLGKSQSGKDGHGKPLGFKTLIKPSQEKVKEHQRALARTVQRLKASSQEQVIGALNPQIVGWSNYYRSVVAKESFSNCDSVLYHILRSWARRRHPNKNMHWIMGKYWAVDHHERWKFQSQTGYALKRHAATPISRHIKVRGMASPYDGNLIYWAQRLKDHPLTHSTVGKLLQAQHSHRPSVVWTVLSGGRPSRTRPHSAPLLRWDGRMAQLPGHPPALPRPET